MRCNSCGCENPVGKKFCGDCGAGLSAACARCGAENPEDKKFCGDCGAPLGRPSVREPPSVQFGPSAAPKIATVGPSPEFSEVPEGERKTVTALFADIKGSMELMEDLDPEEARAIVDPALKLMMDAAHRYDGYIVQSTGDGIFAIFGAPVAREDHPQRALYAALRMQEDLKRYADKLREHGQPPLSVRVGVNAGEVVVRSIQTGDAHTEYTVVIGEGVRKFVEGYSQPKGLGASTIKGVSEPVNVYEVTGLGPLRTRLQRGAGRGLTKFVGRQREMAEMLRALELARQGHGQIVAAMGEPGVGKSRLLHEFKAIPKSDCLTLETFSVSHGRASAYLPLLELLNNYFDIQVEDDARKRREKITGKALTLDRALEDTLPYLFALLGLDETAGALGQMDAQVRQRRTLDAIKRILLRDSLNQPLIIVFEDLHWVDAQTQALLDMLAEAIANARVLMLVNYRPEYRHGWGNKTYYIQLGLDPLERESAEEMLAALLGDNTALDPLRRLIIAKTEGNPFFMEETVLALLDEGTLVRNGNIRLTKSLGELRIPPTVQAILASRIDRLPADDKDLLQTLAVIGKEFPLGLIRMVAGKADDELERMLGDLQLGEFIYEQPALAQVEYAFKHALTQEVAYRSVLQERRKTLHERIAAAIETLYKDKDQLDDYLPDLARHYSHSGNVAKAVSYLHLAGRQAANRSAHAEALEYYQRGLEFLNNGGDARERARGELPLQMGFAVSLRATKGFIAPEVERAYLRAQHLCTEIGDHAQLFSVIQGLHSLYSLQGELGKARELEGQLLALGERLQQPALLAQAHLTLGVRAFYRGEFSAVRAHCEQAIASPLATRRRHTIFAEALGYLAQALWLLGYPDQMARRLREAQVAARESEQSLMRVNVLNYSAMCHLFISDARSIRELTRTGLALAAEGRFPYQLAIMTFFAGCALVQEGQEEQGFDDMRRGIEALGAIGAVPLWMRFALSLSCLRARRVEEGLKLLAEAPRLDAEMHRIKGELILLGDPSATEDAERCIRTGIEIARRQEAKSWELRATTSLARVLVRNGKPAEARTALATIYNWFTEGFDTADLKEAKALLDDLHR